MNSIFDYLDYRTYLNDFYEEQKKRNYFYSYRYMAGKMAIDHSLLAKILLCKRHITEKHVKPLIALCHLTGNEALFFEALVNFCKAKSDRMAKLFFERMLSLKSYQSQTIEHYQYEYFQKWHHAAIRSLLDHFDFRGDYELLATHLNPSISATQAMRSIELLEKLNLIKKVESGRYLPTNEHVNTGASWKSIAIEAYQKETIELSAGALERDPRETRDISSITMSLDKECFDAIVDMAKEFRASVIRRVNEVSVTALDRVYQLNIQLIPLTKIDRNNS